MGLGKTLCVISLVHTVLRSPILQDASRIEDRDDDADAASASGAASASAAAERGDEGNPPPEGTRLARRSGRLRTVLIIAPKNVTFNWQTEMRKWSGATTGRNKSTGAVPVCVLDSDTSKNIEARAKILVEWFNKAQRGYAGGSASSRSHGYDEDDGFIDDRSTDEEERSDAASESDFESDSDSPARKKLRKSVAEARKQFGNVLVMGYDMYRNLVKLVPDEPPTASAAAAGPYDNALAGRGSAEEAETALRARFNVASTTRSEYVDRVKQSGPTKTKNAAAFFLQYVTADMKKRYGSAKPPRHQAGNRPDRYHFWSPKQSRWFDCIEEAARRWSMVSARLGGQRIQHNNNHDRTHMNEWEDQRRQAVDDADEESANHLRIQAIVRHTLISPGPDMLVCDEGHMLRKHSSARSLALRRCDSLRRLILTGTPMQNNLEEYHCMVDMVRPAHLGNLKEFQVRVTAPGPPPFFLSLSLRIGDRSRVCAAALRHASFAPPTPAHVSCLTRSPTPPRAPHPHARRQNQFANPIKQGQTKDASRYELRKMKRRSHVLHTKLMGFVQRRSWAILRTALGPKSEHVLSIDLTPLQDELRRGAFALYSFVCSASFVCLLSTHPSSAHLFVCSLLSVSRAPAEVYRAHGREGGRPASRGDRTHDR